MNSETKEEIQLIPTYNIGDLVENVSLRNWVKTLHEVSDLEYVQFTNLEEYLKSHPPVSKVSFGQDTADGSFDGYNSWAEKSYSHDFWAEVVQDRRTHTLIQKLFKKILNSPIPENIQEELNNSYEKRLCLTSTTNFGMATPFLARDRERVVEQIIEEMKSHSQKAWKQSLDLFKKYFSTK